MNIKDWLPPLTLLVLITVIYSSLTNHYQRYFALASAFRGSFSMQSPNQLYVFSRNTRGIVKRDAVSVSGVTQSSDQFIQLALPLSIDLHLGTSETSKDNELGLFPKGWVVISQIVGVDHVFSLTNVNGRAKISIHLD